MTASCIRNALMLGATFAGISTAAPTFAQEAGAVNAGEIIVTARRTEERLQDVPISMTVFNEQQIANRNIAVATDLATYTPSLSVNERYGPEKASFALRGFNQDQSTAPTVGVYFADVVGVRAQGGTTSGNTVGAGAFTDLQNVQVLKGPQGTLFGRNTTGGAVLLVPAKPTDNLEGYVEGTIGNYDARRVQAALNVPLADTFKVRLSVDRNKRDGYMKNHSGIGPDAYNDLDYFYGRLSIVADLTPDLENYTIFHYSKSDTNGYAARLIGCDSDFAATASPIIISNGRPTINTKLATAGAACDQIARQTARGDGVYDVEVNSPDPFLKLEQWQAINTTTWQVSDAITLKNIMSYGEFRERTSFTLNSDNFFVPDQFTGILPTVGDPFQYILLDVSPNEDNSNESTFTEELQLQGHTEKLNWVIGGYLETSKPMGWSAGRTNIFGHCTDTENLVCEQPLGFGIISASSTRISFYNKGLFAQGTYKFNDQFSVTAGARYTWDKITGQSRSSRLTLIPLPTGGFFPILACNDPRANGGAAPATISDCLVFTGDGLVDTPKSNKPTWLIDVDFKPTPDTLLYAKYSRGYRQGGLNFTNPGIETWGPEKLDAYEIGAKASFRGAVNGYFNIAGFYNDFSGQQVFAQLIAKPESGLAGGAAIINAGKSRIYGVEVDTSLEFFDSLRIDAGYTYLNTRIQELTAPTLDADSPFAQIIPNGNAGDPLALSPKHKLTVTGTYTLPLDESIGEVSVSATYIYTSKQIVTTAETLTATPVLGFDPGVLGSRNLVNLNLNWNDVAGMPVDLAVFATNVTKEKYRVNIGQSWNSAGFENALYGAPRMYGVRLRYKFGQ